jgi:hypothetical protein
MLRFVSHSHYLEPLDIISLYSNDGRPAFTSVALKPFEKRSANREDKTRTVSPQNDLPRSAGWLSRRRRVFAGAAGARTEERLRRSLFWIVLYFYTDCTPSVILPYVRTGTLRAYEYRYTFLNARKARGRTDRVLLTVCDCLSVYPPP